MRLRVIQVGLGSWGRNWYKEVLRRCKGVTVVALVDSSEEAVATARSEIGFKQGPCFASLEDAMRAVSADALLVTASLGAHASACRTGLAAGLHVLVEKPFVSTEKEARDLTDFARRRRRVLMVSQNYRFHPSVRAVQKLIRGRHLGQVATISIDFRRYANDRSRRHGHYHLSEPLLRDMAIHQMDLTRAVLGCEPEEVLCWSHNPGWSKFVDAPSASALMTFAGGVHVNYRGSWIAHEAQTPWAGLWTIECERGAIVWSSRGGDGDEWVEVHHCGETKGIVKLPKLRFVDRAGTLEHFLQCVKRHLEPETSARDNTNTIRLVNALISSGKNGRPVKL
jgi:predicted dehydrogenase